MADEALYDFVFIQAAKKAEVVNLACKIAVDVMLEVAFKLETLGILVVNGGAGDVAFVGASLIGQDDVCFLVEIGRDVCGKG